MIQLFQLWKQLIFYLNFESKWHVFLSVIVSHFNKSLIKMFHWKYTRICFFLVETFCGKALFPYQEIWWNYNILRSGGLRRLSKITATKNIKQHIRNSWNVTKIILETLAAWVYIILLHSENLHCVKVICIWCYSRPHFPTFGLNTEVRKRENAEQNNSEYGHFLYNVRTMLRLITILVIMFWSIKHF